MRKLPANLTFEEVGRACIRRINSLDNPGFCLSCGEEHFACEPDAREYYCENCGENEVFGAEEIIFLFF